MKYYKSPFNYIGNKYRILEDIFVYFPSDIGNFVDLFCGGGDVITNVHAKKKYANDVNKFLIGIYKEFQEKEDVISLIETTISKWNLTKTNEKEFNAFREYYNANQNPLDLFVLLCYSYNNQMRFNSMGIYNSSFGKNRSSFNEVMKKNLENFLKNIASIEFSASDFREYDLSFLSENDFVYCDPPYLISRGNYNDGKRGFIGWSEEKDRDLFSLLDGLTDRGIKFALSNVTEHKGEKNEPLIKWIEDNHYTIHDISISYGKSSYNIIDRNSFTREILVTNY